MSTKKNKMKLNMKKAFTLVELIIVIAVIAILAIFLLPNFTSVLGDANSTNVKSDTANMSSVVTAYIAEVGAVPVANASSVAGDILTIGDCKPGISVSTFMETAAKDTYYAIDMDLLLKPQIKIDDKVSKTVPKLGALPATSAIANIPEGNKSNSDTFETNKRIKNNSVVYVIDKDLNVYAAYNKQIKKEKSAFSIFSTDVSGKENWIILSDALGLSTSTTVSHNENFKVPVTAIKATNIAASLVADDSNYN